MKTITYKQYESAIKRAVNDNLKNNVQTFSEATVENKAKVIKEERSDLKELVVVDDWREIIKETSKVPYNYDEAPKGQTRTDLPTFIEYVHAFYGKDTGLYAADYDGGFGIAEIAHACTHYFNTTNNWGGGDTVDREHVIYLLANK